MKALDFQVLFLYACKDFCKFLVIIMDRKFEKQEHEIFGGK